jgi:hypothetical protein
MTTDPKAVCGDIQGGGGQEDLGRGARSGLVSFPERNVAFLLCCGSQLPRSLDYTTGKKKYSEGTR